MSSTSTGQSMDEQINPYAAPSTIETAADTAQLAGSPMESLRGVAAGLAIICVAVSVWGVHELLDLATYIHGTIGLIGVIRFPRGFYRGIPLAMEILYLFGKIRCASVPAESRARGWISASVMSNALIFLFYLPWFVVLRFEGMEKAWWLFDVLSIFSAATFFLFLRRLALFIDRPDRAKRALTLLVLYGVWEASCYGMPHVEVWLFPWAITDHGVAPWFHRFEFLVVICEYVLTFVIIAKYFNLARGIRAAIRGKSNVDRAAE